jgi:hypothetical protein
MFLSLFSFKQEVQIRLIQSAESTVIEQIAWEDSTYGNLFINEKIRLGRNLGTSNTLGELVASIKCTVPTYLRFWDGTVPEWIKIRQE